MTGKQTEKPCSFYMQFPCDPICEGAQWFCICRHSVVLCVQVLCNESMQVPRDLMDPFEPSANMSTSTGEM